MCLQYTDWKWSEKKKEAFHLFCEVMKITFCLLLIIFLWKHYFWSLQIGSEFLPLDGWQEKFSTSHGSGMPTCFVSVMAQNYHGPFLNGFQSTFQDWLGIQKHQNLGILSSQKEKTNEQSWDRSQTSPYIKVPANPQTFPFYRHA